MRRRRRPPDPLPRVSCREPGAPAEPAGAGRAGGPESGAWQAEVKFPQSGWGEDRLGARRGLARRGGVDIGLRSNRVRGPALTVAGAGGVRLLPVEAHPPAAVRTTLHAGQGRLPRPGGLERARAAEGAAEQAKPPLGGPPARPARPWARSAAGGEGAAPNSSAPTRRLPPASGGRQHLQVRARHGMAALPAPDVAGGGSSPRWVGAGPLDPPAGLRAQAGREEPVAHRTFGCPGEGAPTPGPPPSLPLGKERCGTQPPVPPRGREFPLPSPASRPT